MFPRLCLKKRRGEGVLITSHRSPHTRRSSTRPRNAQIHKATRRHRHRPCNRATPTRSRRLAGQSSIRHASRQSSPQRHCHRVRLLRKHRQRSSRTSHRRPGKHRSILTRTRIRIIHRVEAGTERNRVIHRSKRNPASPTAATTTSIRARSPLRNRKVQHRR
jgi:hypothetical protein